MEVVRERDAGDPQVTRCIERGKIAPYDDPEVFGATLDTHFTGHVGEWIEGTFVTYSDHGVSPRRGTWRVHRKRAE